MEVMKIDMVYMEEDMEVMDMVLEVMEVMKLDIVMKEKMTNHDYGDGDGYGAYRGGGSYG